MYPTYFLQWWAGGTWNEIAWRASTPGSLEDLRKHAEDLAQDGGWYQLVCASVFAAGPPTVVEQWGVQ